MGSNCCKSTRVHVAEEPQMGANDNFNLSKSESDLTGAQRPYQWRMGELIGQGTAGKVYQAMDEETGHLLAVKIIKLDNNPFVAEKQFHSLSQEINLLKTLRHVHIVRYLQTDIAIDERQVKILLEYVPGGSLYSILNKFGPLSQKVIKSYSYQIAKGLQYLHSHHVVHRDLKSPNVLVTDDAVIKLIDFGCSKKCEEGEINISMNGSPYWMAPEVVLQQGHGFSSDIWSFGCLLIEMCTGKPPWSEHSKKAVDIIKLISIPGKLPKFPQGPPQLLDLITACTNRDPERRPRADQILRHHFFSNVGESASFSLISKTSSFTWCEAK